jgi:hypothetical protein
VSDALTLLFYDYVEDVVERRGPYRDAHIQRFRDLKDRGRLVMAGAVGDPPHGGLIVLRDMDAGEIAEWVAADPYVKAGLVTGWRTEPWTVVV